MKISARNCFRGTVEDVEDGVVTSKVKIKIEMPITLTAVITKEAVKDLGLKRGEKAIAIIKSTSVMIAKD
ncbi:MAG: TOBE domain-containing protein [Candidatus Methanomethylicaceae archaeon]